VGRIAQLVGPAGVIEEVLRGERHVEVTRLADGLAVVEGLEHRELPRALLQAAGDAEEVLAAGPAGELLPDLVVSLARGSDGGVDRGLAGGPDTREDLAGGGVEHVEVAGIVTVDEGAIDEVAVALLDPDRMGLGGRGELERALQLELRPGGSQGDGLELGVVNVCLNSTGSRGGTCD